MALTFQLHVLLLGAHLKYKITSILEVYTNGKNYMFVSEVTAF